MKSRDLNRFAAFHTAAGTAETSLFTVCLSHRYISPIIPCALMSRRSVDVTKVCLPPGQEGTLNHHTPKSPKGTNFFGIVRSVLLHQYKQSGLFAGAFASGHMEEHSTFFVSQAEVPARDACDGARRDDHNEQLQPRVRRSQDLP